MSVSIVQFPARPARKHETSRKLAFTTAALRKLVADESTPPSLADTKQPGLFLRRAKSGRWSFVFERRIKKRLFRQNITPWADRCDLDLIRQDAARLLRDARTGQWAADLVAATPPVNPRIGFTWEQALEAHAELNETRLATRRQYAVALRVMGPHLPARVADLTPGQWREVYLLATKKGGLPTDAGPHTLSAATASAYGRGLAAAWETWAFGLDENERPARNPIKAGMQIGPRKSLWRTPDPRTGHLTLEQIGPWLQALRQRSEAVDPTHASACAALELLTLTGLRSKEALGMTWAEVGDDGWFEISAARMKAKVAFRRPITRRVAEILDAQRQITGGVGHVFPSWKKANTHLVDLRKVVAPIAEAVGAPGLTPHDLRRTWASIAKANRVDPAIEKRLMAHGLGKDVHERHYANAITDFMKAEAQRIEDVLTGAAE